MKLIALTLASLGLASAAAVSNKVSYDGWKVYRVTVGNNAAKLTQLMDSLQLKKWIGNVDTSKVVDLVVAPSQLLQWEQATKDIQKVIMHEDLGASIAEESANSRIYTKATTAAAPSLDWFNSYHPIADHYQWQKDLSAAYPSNSEIFSVGTSTQGQSIQGIRIWGSGGKGSKPAIVIHATVHSREWIGSMVAEYAAYQLLTSTNVNDKAIKEKFEIFILAITNPDGFKYTQTTDRLWRKNRLSISSSTCVGTDINRNWPNHWDQRVGASTSPCAEDYKGTSSGSTVENVALRNHLNSVAAAQGVQMYLDIHSYSQLWMYPYGYSCTSTLPSASTYNRLTAGAVAALKAVHGTTFDYGPICNTIYQVSGSSVDYAYEQSKVNISMTVELRDTGNYGFVLPASQILPSGEETWAGLSYLWRAF